MIDAARARFPGLAFDVGDAQALDQPDAGFDAVACNMGLFHMTDPARAMTEAARVLRPGGRFSFSQWAAPDASALYGTLFGILREEADLSRADPAPAVFDALRDRAEHLLPISRTTRRDGKYHDPSGRWVSVLFVDRIEWRDERTAEVTAGVYGGPRAAWSHRLRVHERDGAWVVEDLGLEWIS